MTHEIFFRVCYNFYRQAPLPPQLIAHHDFRPAVLHGYNRRRVRHTDYPGICPCKEKDATVRGRLVKNITPAMMQKLDWFESNVYERVRVKVRVLGNGQDGKVEEDHEGDEVADVVTYVFRDEGSLEEEEWDFEEFKRDKLQNWV